MPAGCVALLASLGIGPVLGQPVPTVPTIAPVATVTAPGDDEIPLVTSRQEVLDAAGPVEFPKSPTLVRHRPTMRERVTHIAVRYGVTREQLVRWNPKLPPNASFAPRRRKLKIYARRLPPPRQKVRYQVQEGENWMDIACKFHIEHRDLHAYNWKTKRLWAGRQLVLWIDPGFPETIFPDQGPPVPSQFDIPTGALSVGRPDRGRLLDGIELPDSPLYTRKHPTSGLWGSSHTVLQIHRALAGFRHHYGFEGEVVIGAISRRRGGRFSPHRSHQSGRDIDIRLPTWPSLSGRHPPREDEIDWYATWGLIKSFIDTGEVDTIFLDVSRHRNLYEAARTMGETPQSLEAVIKWPQWSGRSRPVVRHSKGHDTHIHVRIKCGPDEPRCRTR